MMSEEAKSEFYNRIIWTRYVIAFLGVWLLGVALSFNYSSDLLWWSDFLCGLALLVSGIYALTGHNDLAPWDSCAIGLWLLTAPVLFWAPEPFIYLNDTSIGVLALAFGSLIPGVAEDVLREGGKEPPGWSYNPSSWMQRLPIIAFAVCGWLFSVYMATYQLGYRDHADFLFGRGTTKTLESSLTGHFPMADAGFAAIIFLLVAILASLGSSHRWHSMPWVVTLFGGMSVLLGISSAFYTFLQPLVIGYWCGWCVLTTLCALSIIALSIDEMIAVFVYLLNIRKSGKPVSQVFWQGDGDGRKTSFSQEVVEPFSLREMFRGMGWNWMQAVCLLIGAGLIVSGNLFAQDPSSAVVIHSIGALIFIVSLLAFAEILSALRYLNGVLALGLMMYVWMASGIGVLAALLYTVSAGILIALSLWKRETVESYGDADKLIV